MSTNSLKSEANIQRLRLAVMSDLHCHHDQRFKKDVKPITYSYLTTNKLRSPSPSHPVVSLLEVIEREKLKADFLLCPGDITNQVDIQGFISGWDYIKEVAEALDCQESIATIGNHDVDSRFNFFDKILELARGIKKDYPIKDEQLRDKFWSNGFCFVEKSDVRILVINSAFWHENKEQTVQGKIDEAQLQEIQDYLSKNVDSKIQIALCHHHPIGHSRMQLGTEDVIVLGDELMNKLNNFGFDLLIHGHKHDAWLRYAHGTSYRVPIFSAGSFSAVTNQMITGSKNTFHIVELSKEPGRRAKGKIITWEFLPSNGWRLADSGDHYFPQHTGFGFSGDLDDLVKSTIEIIDSGNGNFLDWSDFVNQLGEVEFLTPDECITFKSKLGNSGIITHPELPKKPSHIGKLSH